jgi:hypothetical protein
VGGVVEIVEVAEELVGREGDVVGFDVDGAV